MKKTLPWSSLLFLACAASAHAQLYKWVGPDGKVNYTDTPPPRSAAQAEAKSISAGGSPASNLPYELAQAAKSHPVTLYTMSNCAPCDEGRRLLAERGIPFAEKTVTSNDDIAQFKKINGDAQLPFLTIGRSSERGFEPSAWNTALSAAGYPESNKLPKHYRNPPVQALAPQQLKPVAARADAASTRTTDGTSSRPGATALPPAIGNAPPGFRF